MIKLLKSGQWALEGLKVVEVVEGEEKTFGAQSDVELVQAGWAEWVQAEKPETAPKAPRKKAE